MQIKISNHFTPAGTEFYEWDLYDGPDGIDHVHGYASDLIQAFSKIVEWQDRIGRDYAEELEQDLDTLTTFFNNNETEQQATD